MPLRGRRLVESGAPSLTALQGRGHVDGDPVPFRPAPSSVRAPMRQDRRSGTFKRDLSAEPEDDASPALDTHPRGHAPQSLSR